MTLMIDQGGPHVRLRDAAHILLAMARLAHPRDLQGVTIGITAVGQHANLKASAIPIGDLVGRDGQAVSGRDHHRHGRLGPCPSITGLNRWLVTAVDIGVEGWLTDKSQPHYFSSRFLVFKAETGLTTHGILLFGCHGGFGVRFTA